MEQIIIEMLSNLGLGINGIIDQQFNNEGKHFADHLNSFTKNKFDFQVVKHNGFNYHFKANNGVVLIYTVNESGAITNLKVEKK